MLFVSMLAAAAVAITPSELTGLPRTTATLDLHGERHSCTGPLLSDVLHRAGAPAGESLRGNALKRGVLVSAKDGYAVLFGLGELDHTLGNVKAILADQCDGKRLADSDGPVRLVVEGDKRPARSVRQVVRIDWVGPQP